MRKNNSDASDHHGGSTSNDVRQIGNESYLGSPTDPRLAVQRTFSKSTISKPPPPASRYVASWKGGDDASAQKPSKLGTEGAPMSRPPQPEKQTMFVDACAMKEKMRMQLSKPEYKVEHFYHTEGRFQAIARSPWFDRISLVVITFNAVWISIDADHNDAETLAEAGWPFFVADNFFCAFFLFEWFVRFMAFKRKQDGFRDAWFVFDMVMVILMVLETWVLTLVFLLVGGGGAGAGNAGVLKLIRLSRLSRMARMARLLRVMPELLVLLKGMWAATRSVFFTLFLLFIILYIFGIAFKQLAAGTSVGDDHFRTVPVAMHTLLLRGTLMDEMTDMVNEMTDSGEYVLLVGFYAFVLLSALTVMNMLIGVLCEVVAAVAATEKEESSVAYVKWRIKDVMKHGGLDLDGDGRISKDEFCKILDDPRATRTLSNAGVDVFGLVDCADFIFGEGSPFASSHEEGGEILLNFSDFMELVLQLRGSNVATVKDLVDLRKFLTITTGRIEAKLEQMDFVLESITRVNGANNPKPIPPCQDPSCINGVKSSSEPIRLGVDEELDKSQGPLHSASSLQDKGKAIATPCPGHMIGEYDVLNQIITDLDQLRNYVDAELSVVMGDLARRSETISYINSDGPHSTCLNMEQNCSGEQTTRAYDDFTSDGANHVRPLLSTQDSSWERSSFMCPGAELRKPMSCGL